MIIVGQVLLFHIIGFCSQQESICQCLGRIIKDWRESCEFGPLQDRKRSWQSEYETVVDTLWIFSGLYIG